MNKYEKISNFILCLGPTHKILKFLGFRTLNIYKVNELNLVVNLNGTLVFEWYGVRCRSKSHKVNLLNASRMKFRTTKISQTN